MNIYTLEEKVIKAQKNFQTIQENAKNTSKGSSKQFKAIMLEELSTALEELHVAVEEIQNQNEELIANRELLELERQRYLDLFEFAPDGYIVTDEQGIIQEINRAAQALFGVRRNLMVNKPLIIYIAQTDRQSFHEQLDRLKQIKKLQDWEIQLQPRSGDAFPVAIAVSTINDNKGKVVGWRWLIRDLTQIKQAEETNKRLEKEKEISALKSTLLRNISYYLCEPLNLISFSTQLLSTYNERLDGVKVKMLFQKINTALARLFRLSDDSLFFSRLEEGKEEWKATTIDVEQFCQNLIEHIQFYETGNRKICFSSQTRFSTIYIDRQFLQQILENLLLNALQSSFKDSTIDFNLSASDREIIFRIQDSSAGISSENLLYVFEPFYGAKEVEKKLGVGLGLSIVKKAVELSGGTVSVESEIGVGTCFTVALPVQAQNVGGGSQEKLSGVIVS